MKFEGFLNVNKPDGMTSTQVLRVIKKVLKSKKIGYIGTLDPIAKGVLLVGLERATRLIPFLEKQEKVYDAVMTLGAETDTQDLTGQILNEADPSAVTEEMVRDVMGRYSGEIEQTPPMFSAKKIEGKRLYDLARQGLSVERKPVKVTIHEMNFLGKEGPDVHFTARVSTGAYMRTLCHDMGRDLGVYGHLKTLTRLRAGVFGVDTAIPFEDITPENLDTVREKLISLADGLAHISKAVVVGHAAEKLKHGSALGVSEIVEFENVDGGGLVRIVTRDGTLLGVGEADGPPIAGFPFGAIKPKRVLT